MSKLEELIARLCPDGVEYKELKAFSKVLRGKRLTKNQLLKDGKYPVYHGGLEPLGYYNESNRNANTVMIINVGASAGTVGFCDIDFWSSDGCFCMEKSTCCIDKFLYYFLMTIENTIKSRVRHAGIPTLDAQVIDKIKVPVPPLEVQREIVHILDSFTSLTEELEKELAARQKQYRFYRDALLTFKNIDDIILNERTNELELSNVVRWMKLGDIGPVCMCKRILKSETNSQSGVPFYKIGTFGKEADAYISHEKFSEYKAKYNFPKKGDVLISAAGTIGRTVIYDGKPAYFQDSNIVWIDNDETQVTNAFLKYYYSMKPWKSSDGGTISRLYNDDIRKTPVPVPPLSEQQRIVDILDRFDALCNDITSGLPAEIEARKKQYEYYRDKLLTFKELKKEA